MNSNMVKPKKIDHLHSVDDFTVALKLQCVARKHFQFSVNIFVLSYRYLRFWKSWVFLICSILHVCCFDR